MKCQQVPLLEFLRSELEAKQIERTLEHLEGCSECRERLQVIIRLETIDAGRRVKRKTSRMWLIAAALLLAVSIPVPYIGFPAVRALKGRQGGKRYDCGVLVATPIGALWFVCSFALLAKRVRGSILGCFFVGWPVT